MKKASRFIGFDDRFIAVVMIPLTALLIPLVFFGRRFGRPPYFTWQVYVTTLITTTLIWIGNRYIMVWARKKYPHFEQTRKRLLVQSVIMFFYTLLATNSMHFLLKISVGYSRQPIGTSCWLIFCSAVMQLRFFVPSRLLRFMKASIS